MKPPAHAGGLIQYFSNIRSFIGDVEKPMTMGVIDDWQRHTYVNLERWERECLFAMDRALRHAYTGVVKYHAGRKPITALMSGSRDLARARTG